MLVHLQQGDEAAHQVGEPLLLILIIVCNETSDGSHFVHQTIKSRTSQSNQHGDASSVRGSAGCALVHVVSSEVSDQFVADTEHLLQWRDDGQQGLHLILEIGVTGLAELINGNPVQFSTASGCLDIRVTVCFPEVIQAVAAELPLLGLLACSNHEVCCI